MKKRNWKTVRWFLIRNVNALQHPDMTYFYFPYNSGTKWEDRRIWRHKYWNADARPKGYHDFSGDTAWVLVGTAEAGQRLWSRIK